MAIDRQQDQQIDKFLDLNILTIGLSKCQTVQIRSDCSFWEKTACYYFCIFWTLHILYGPRQANLVVITYASSEGSGEPAHPRSLARTCAARSYKQWVKRNLQTESQIPGLSEWLGKICHDRMLEDTNSLDAACMVKPYSNALANITQSLIGWCQNFATVHPAICCWKSDVITQHCLSLADVWFYDADTTWL